MNEIPSHHKALDAVNQKPRFFRPSIQNALGALLVVLVTTSFTVILGLRDSTRDNARDLHQHVNSAHAKHPVEWKEFDDLRDQFTAHAIDGKRKHALIDQSFQHEHEAIAELKAFMNKGGRFTRDDGDRLEARLRRVEEQLRRCRCGVGEPWSLPPYQRNEEVPGLRGDHSNPVVRQRASD